MSKRNGLTSIWAGLVGVLLLGAAAPTAAQESGVEMWGRACARCHRAQPPNKYDAEGWRKIMPHMALTARLTPQEEAAITEFLVAAARPLAANPEPRPERGVVAPPEDGALAQRVVSTEPTVPSTVIASSDSAAVARGAAVYRSQCTACHGKNAKGDGPVAAALTPRPPDLTQSARVRTMSAEELLGFLSVGKGSMPGFGKILTAQELRDVTAWARSLNTTSR